MCGISAFLGKPGEKFPYADFVILSREQDSRGGDSCGFAVRTKSKENPDKSAITVTWGCKEEKGPNTAKMLDFFSHRGTEIRDMDMNDPAIVIGHARKASYASSADKDGAHPFYTENIVGVHNGIIRDWRKLAAVFNVDVKDVDVDSEALYRIISAGHMDVLRCYDGDAALIWIDRRDLTVNVWVGSKTTYSYISKKDTVEYERTLHYWESKSGIYISSEYPPLMMLKGLHEEGYLEKSLFHFRGNHVTVIKDGEIIDEIEMPRMTLADYIKSNNLEVEVKKEEVKIVLPAEEKIIKKDDCGGFCEVLPKTEVKVEIKSLVDYNDVGKSNKKTTDLLLPFEVDVHKVKTRLTALENKHYNSSKEPGELTLFNGLLVKNNRLYNNLTGISRYIFKNESIGMVYQGLRIKLGKEDKFLTLISDTDGVTDRDLAPYVEHPIPSGWLDLIRFIYGRDLETNESLDWDFHTLIVDLHSIDRFIKDGYMYYNDDRFDWAEHYTHTYSEVNTKYIFSHAYVQKEEVI